VKSPSKVVNICHYTPYISCHTCKKGRKKKGKGHYIDFVVARSLCVHGRRGLALLPGNLVYHNVTLYRNLNYTADLLGRIQAPFVVKLVRHSLYNLSFINK
jgi:hypothetical protein